MKPVWPTLLQLRRTREQQAEQALRQAAEARDTEQASVDQAQQRGDIIANQRTGLLPRDGHPTRGGLLDIEWTQQARLHDVPLRRAQQCVAIDLAHAQVSLALAQARVDAAARTCRQRANECLRAHEGLRECQLGAATESRRRDELKSEETAMLRTGRVAASRGAGRRA